MSSPYSTPSSAHRATVLPGSEFAVAAMLTGLTWRAMAATGVFSVVLGAIVLAWPGATLLVVGILFGIYLLVFGVFNIIGAFGQHVPGHLRAIGLVVGALAIVLGLICFRRPAESILLLAFWIGFVWIMHGIGQIVTAASAPAFDGRGWVITFGVIVTIAGIVVVTSPLTSITALTVLAGIWLVVIGVLEVVEAVRLRRTAQLVTETP